jgi:SH3-like domain-containing protein
MQVSVVKTAAMALGLAALMAGAAVGQDKPVDDTGDLTRGAVTSLPLPRYVSLKTNEGNARRGPGLTHRIDWVFSRAGMPLRVTAEYENWRRIEDAEGAGGWVHYSLLSGTRSILVTDDMLDLHASPLPDGAVVLRAEAGVIGRLVECKPDWCMLNIDGEKGWAPKSGFWGVDPGESFE